MSPRTDPGTTSAAALAAATPADRDRYMDLLRVASIGTVVVGHWLMAVVTPTRDGVQAGNAIAAIPYAWALTWVFQVMPLFFLVGGFAHATALRRRPPYAEFVRARMTRLLRPSVVFLAVWTAIAVTLELTGAQTGVGALASATIVQPLWFLGVYLGVMGLAPAMHRWHRAHGMAVPVVLVILICAVDAVRFGAGLGAIGTLNLALVWLFVHQLGFLYADGRLTRAAGAAMAVAGLAVVVTLTLVTHLYPLSMVGLPGERVSNMSPPTAALAAHATWLVGLAVLLKGRLSRWLQRPRVWTAVITANGVVMTVFLWHLTALFALYAAAIGLELDLPRPGSAMWGLTRPVWVAVLASITVGLVAAFRRFERPGPRATGGGSSALAAAGAAAATVGMLGISVAGLDGVVALSVSDMAGVPMTPVAALALIAGGWALLALRAGGSSAQVRSVNESFTHIPPRNGMIDA